MNFYAIVARGNVAPSESELSLRKACESRGLRYNRIAADELSLADVVSSAPARYDGLLYRIGTTAKAVDIEAVIANLHPGATTIYYPQTLTYPRKNVWELSIQLAQNINIIPTILVDESWLNMTDKVIAGHIDSVGGFPIVLKVLGLSHGQGVQKIDSLDKLREAIQAMDFSQSSSTIIRKYLADYRHYRLIMVAGKVAAAIEYHKPDDDFRTNATAEPKVTAIDLSKLQPEAIELARKGTAIRSSILSGVDILVDSSTGESYLAEVNVPCNFARAEGPTGVDIGDLIVQALLDKRKNAAGEHHGN